MDNIEKNFADLESYSPKKLRTLRNNLNNRLAHFSGHADKPKELASSHKLYGLEEEECKLLLNKVQKLIIAAKK